MRVELLLYFNVSYYWSTSRTLYNQYHTHITIYHPKVLVICITLQYAFHDNFYPTWRHCRRWSCSDVIVIRDTWYVAQYRDTVILIFSFREIGIRITDIESQYRPKITAWYQNTRSCIRFSCIFWELTTPLKVRSYQDKIKLNIFEFFENRITQ